VVVVVVGEEETEGRVVWYEEEMRSTPLTVMEAAMHWKT